MQNRPALGVVAIVIKNKKVLLGNRLAKVPVREYHRITNRVHTG
jgi:hypothetical protein